MEWTERGGKAYDSNWERPETTDMRRKLAVRGLMTALLTPFDEQGDVDDDALSDLVRFQISKGTEGLYPCGTTGSGPMLRIEERKGVAETVVKEASGSVPVVVQVGSADTGSCVELARHAEKVGADAVASLTPYYYKPGEIATIRHFERIARSVNIPLFAYNIPQFTGNNIQSSTVVRLAKAKTILGLKDSSRDFLHLLDVLESVPDEFILMNGTEEYGLFAIMAGADGLVSGGANAFPEVFKDLVTAQREGNYSRALAAQEKVIKIKNVVSSGPIASYYQVLKERGIDCGEPRPPILPLDRTASAHLSKRVSSLELW